jgi:serine phosphatase RsbU (regulator of sigma subunit)
MYPMHNYPLLTDISTTQEASAGPTEISAPDQTEKKQFDKALLRVYLHGDKIVLIAILIHVVIAMLLSLFYDTWYVAVPVSLVAAGAFALSYFTLPGSLTTRISGGLALQAFVILFIYQMRGQAEMHFFFFTSLAILVFYQDWRCLWPGALLIILQQLLFAMLHNAGIDLYFFEAVSVGLTKLGFHVGLVMAHLIICSILAHQLSKQTYLDARYTKQLAEQQEQVAKALQLIKKDNFRKTTELEEARILQLSLLPQQPPQLPHLQLSFYMNTSTEVGGDYYDYKLNERDGSITIAIGDATGHGLKAGIMVATVKSYFQTLADRFEPSDILNIISGGIKSLNIRGMYMGLTIIKIRGNSVCMASAGMPPAYHYSGAFRRITSITHKGPFLGFGSKSKYEFTTLTLAPGDTLLGLTDGLTELFNTKREMLGDELIEKNLARHGHLSPDDLLNEFVEMGNQWSGGRPNEDDITMVAIKAL